MPAADSFDAMADAARKEWADPLASARSAVTALLELAIGEWEPRGLLATQSLRSKRADSALLLAATEVALEPNPLRAADGLRDILRRLNDESWAAELGVGIAHHGTIGVLSLGAMTRHVLSSIIELGGTQPELFCDKRAVARGLGYLDLPILATDPARAEVLLLPVAAQHKERVWTTSHNAAVAAAAGDAGRTIIPIRHPLACLSPLNRLAYRPESFLIDVLI